MIAVPLAISGGRADSGGERPAKDGRTGGAAARDGHWHGLQRRPPGRALAASRLAHAVLAALVLLLIGLSGYPAPPLLTLIRATASMVAR
jgi:hypothetical protein